MSKNNQQKQPTNQSNSDTKTKVNNPQNNKEAVTSDKPSQNPSKDANKPESTNTNNKKATTNQHNATESQQGSTAAKQTGTVEKKTTSALETKPNKLSHAQPPVKEKKSGGLIAPLALAAGLAGTGIGLYNYDQARKSNSADTTAPLLEQIKALESQVKAATNKNALDFTAQLDNINKTVAAVKASEEKANARLSSIEQTQSGLTKTLQGDVKATLDERLNEVNNLLTKIDQIEMTQKGISQNLNQAVSAGEAITSDGMAKQEVGYLLRMANYKIQSEGDAVGAAGLLEIAEKKLLLLNSGQSDNTIENIRQKYIQLRGVKTVDSNALISSLKQLSNTITKLQPKPSGKSVAPVTTETSAENGMLDKVGNIIASGVKYTPNDPSKIDISAETILIEKRLMQADIRTAELAARSHNGVLLAETINSIRDNLTKYFADDDTLKAITSTLDSIEQQKLETVLPDLSDLVEQYEQR